MSIANSILATLDLATPLAASGFVRGVVMTLFIISAVLTLFVILAQEGKGGGLAGAFGGAGADAFGVKAGTVNRVTAWISGAFLALALLYAGLSSTANRATLTDSSDPDIEAFDPANDESTKKEEGATNAGAAKPDNTGSSPNDKREGSGTSEDGSGEKPSDSDGEK